MFALAFQTFGLAGLTASGMTLSHTLLFVVACVVNALARRFAVADELFPKAAGFCRLPCLRSMASTPPSALVGLPEEVLNVRSRSHVLKRQGAAVQARNTSNYGLATPSGAIAAPTALMWRNLAAHGVRPRLCFLGALVGLSSAVTELRARRLAAMSTVLSERKPADVCTLKSLRVASGIAAFGHWFRRFCHVDRIARIQPTPILWRHIRARPRIYPKAAFAQPASRPHTALTAWHAAQVVLSELHAGAHRNLAPARLVCRRFRQLCDAQITSHALTLHPRDAAWQLSVLQRFENLRELHADLRNGCTEATELYALLADVVRTVPDLQALHVLCGLTSGDGRLALPFTGATASATQATPTASCVTLPLCICTAR